MEARKKREYADVLLMALMKRFVIVIVIRGEPTEDTPVTLSLITDLESRSISICFAQPARPVAVVRSPLTTRPIVLV